MKRLDETFVKELEEAFSRKEFAEITKITKEQAQSNGTFKFVASSESKDRHGEIVKQDGLDFERFKQNPVILHSHNHNALPVGKATSITRSNGETVIEGIFASHDFAQTVRKLYDEGFVNAVSIGFIPKEFDASDNSVITKSELLEVSIVQIPANPDALRKSFGTDFITHTAELGLIQEKEVEKVTMESLSKQIAELQEAFKSTCPCNTPEEEETTEETMEDGLKSIQSAATLISAGLHTMKKHR